MENLNHNAAFKDGKREVMGLVSCPDLIAFVWLVWEDSVVSHCPKQHLSYLIIRSHSSHSSHSSGVYWKSKE